MKRNAMIRIIIWSISLVLLCGMLFGVLALRQVRLPRADETEYTYPPADYTSVTTYPADGLRYMHSAADEVNVRTGPDPEADVIGMLQAGEVVTVESQEIVNEIVWSHISSPVDGWVQTQYITVETCVETAVPSQPDNTLAFDADKIHSLEIEWVAGHIQIVPTQTDEIRLAESTVSNKRDAMVWELKEGQLSIEFCEDEDRFLSFGIHSTDFQKDLTVYVPLDWECRSLEIDAAAATVEVEGLTVREVEFDGASGACEFRNCTVERMDMDTASGNIRFSGKLETLDCDAASADILAVLENVPSRISVDTMSGDMDITLPGDAGFSLRLDTVSEKFSSEFDDVTAQNGEYVRGNGACRISVSAMSGDVMLRKGASPAQ